MALIAQFVRLSMEQTFRSQQLKRLPEPASLTDSEANVTQYDQVMSTKLVLAYASALTIVHRCRAATQADAAVDLACGPGHYTLCLARHLGYRKVTGIDLAPNMIHVAKQNAIQQKLSDRVQFQCGDILQMKDIESGTLGLASFTDAAHHLPDLQTISLVLREMDRITNPDGLVVLMDLVRLRTAKLTDCYVNTVGQDYIQRGLPQFFEDFRNSMYAAWTAEELHQTIPKDSRRWWCHLVPRGLPTVQIILGLPVGRKKVFVRSGFPWTNDQNPVPKSMRGESRLLRWSLTFASRRSVPPSQAFSIPT